MATQQQVVIRSLGDLQGSSKLAAYCRSCRHSQFLDLEALRTRYGADLSLQSLQASVALLPLWIQPAVMHVWDNGAASAESLNSLR